MTTLQFNRSQHVISIILSLGIVAMMLSLVLLFVLAPASKPPYSIESQQLKVLHYSQAD